MAFEDFLRSIPLVHRHIMRTRVLLHENAKYKKFLARNGFNPEDILADKIQDLSLSSHPIGEDAPVSEETLKTLAESLRREQLRASALEADLYVLQIDYDTLIKMKTSSAS